MNGVYAGALGYADDVTLLCPSLQWMNKMLKICEQYANEYCVTFNATKSIGIHFGTLKELDGFPELNNNKIEWADKVKHLGNWISSDLRDDKDCAAKMSHFIGSVNHVKGNFSSTSQGSVTGTTVSQRQIASQ